MQPSAAPANDGYQLTRVTRSPAHNRDGRHFSDSRGPEHGSPESMVHAIAPLPASELPTSKCDFDAFRRCLHDPGNTAESLWARAAGRRAARCDPQLRGRSKYLRTRDGAVARWRGGDRGCRHQDFRGAGGARLPADRGCGGVVFAPATRPRRVARCDRRLPTTARSRPPRCGVSHRSFVSRRPIRYRIGAPCRRPGQSANR